MFWAIKLIEDLSCFAIHQTEAPAVCPCLWIMLMRLLPSDPCWHTNNFYSTLPLTSIFGDPFPIPPPPQLLPLLTHPSAYSGQSPLNLQSDALKSWTNAQSLWFPWPPHIDCSFELWGLRARLDQLHALLHLYDMHKSSCFFFLLKVERSMRCVWFWCKLLECSIFFLWTLECV